MGYVKCRTMTAVVLFIAGCSSSEPAPPAKTVFDPLTQQMDKAREVQATVDEAAAKTKKAIDDQERGDPNR
jgi:hypothetical protein